MQSWKRELFRPGQMGGGRGRPESELELTQIDTLITQVSRVSRALAEVKESIRCMEELISEEEKQQAELKSELKDSSTLNPMREQQNSLTKANLQASIQLTRDQIDREERENRRLEEEIEILVKRMEESKESKIAKLKEIKDHYGCQLLDREKVQQQKRVVQLEHRRSTLTAGIVKLRQERQRKDNAEWKDFVEAVIQMARFQQAIKTECKSLQISEASVQMMQAAVLSMKKVNTSFDISRRHVKDTNQVIRNISSSSHVNRPNLAIPMTTYGGARNTSSSTYLPVTQGQGTPLARCTFNTSLSHLKLPHVKLGEKKIENYLRSSLNCSGGTLESPGGEGFPQVTLALPSSLAQHQEATPDGLINTVSQITQFGDIPHFSSDKSQRDAGQKLLWSQTPRDKNVSDCQGIARTRCEVTPISFSPAVMSSANTHSFDLSSHKPREMPCSSFSPSPVRTPSASTKNLSLFPKAGRGRPTSPLKFKSVTSPLSRPQCAETPVSRGLGVPHFKLRGMGGQCMMSRHAGVPPSTRGVKVPSVWPRSARLSSSTPYQKSHQKYPGSCLDNTELSRLSLSTKTMTCTEARQESHPSADHPEAAFSKEGVSTSATVTATEGLAGSSVSTLPSDQGEAASTSHIPQPMEVDHNETPEVEETPMPTSQEFKVTEDSTTKDILLKSSSLKVTQHLYNYNKSSNDMCSSFMESSSTSNNIAHSSVQISPLVTSTPEKSVASGLSPDCVTPASIASLSGSLPSSHSTNSGPNNTHFQPKTPITKSLQNKQNLLNSDDKNRSSQPFSSNSPIKGNKFPFTLQNDLQSNAEANQPFNLFGSPVPESPVPASSENSGSNFFMMGYSPNLRQDNANNGLFNFNLGSDGESAEQSGSGFLSSIFDSSSGGNSSADDNTGFRLF